MRKRYMFMRYPEGKAKAVTLSYDDGVLQDMKFSDIITAHNMKCTFNLNSEFGRKDGLSKEQVEEYILSRGHEIAIHGYNHRMPGAIRPIEAIRDILDCRIELEKKYGRIIRGMAYPDAGIRFFTNTSTYEKVQNYLAELDIAYARSLDGDNDLFELPTDWYNWIPTAHHKNPKIMEYIDKFVNLNITPGMWRPRRVPRLFYLWGHSYEFDEKYDNNWDLLERICEKLGGREDIWYATNIEIYDYVKAYNSLVYSADESMIYNPTLQTIWFDIDSRPYVIKPGETLTLE